VKSAASPDPLPSIHGLRAFEAVARTGSISDAAAELGLTIGAVSQHIQKLEAQVGTALVERRGRGIALTARGERYRSRVRAALDALRLGREEIIRARQGPGLCVSALPSPSATWVSAALFAFRERFPDALISLIGTEAEPDLDSGEVDFRISYGHRVHRHRRSVELFTDRVTAACAPSLLKSLSTVSPASALGFPLIDIAWDPEFAQPPGWSEWFRSLGVETGNLSIDMRFSLSSVAIAAAVEGRGLVLAQRSMIDAELRAGRLVAPFEHDLPLREPYFLAWRASALEKIQGTQLQQWLISTGRARV
jgi:LysR family glycine cleavage system transcriptional activator